MALMFMNSNRNLYQLNLLERISDAFQHSARSNIERLRNNENEILIPKLERLIVNHSLLASQHLLKPVQTPEEYFVTMILQHDE